MEKESGNLKIHHDIEVESRSKEGSELIDKMCVGLKYANKNGDIIKFIQPQES